MVKLIGRIFFLFILLVIFSIQGSTGLEQKNPFQSQKVQTKNQKLSQIPHINPDFGKIPLYFIPNEGQVAGRALFYAKTSRYTLWLTKQGLVFDSLRKIEKGDAIPKSENLGDDITPGKITFERDVSRLSFINANPNPELISDGDTEHNTNYLIGNDECIVEINCQGNVIHDNDCTLTPSLNYFSIILIISITIIGVSVFMIQQNAKKFKRPQEDLDFL